MDFSKIYHRCAEKAHSAWQNGIEAVNRTWKKSELCERVHRSALNTIGAIPGAIWGGIAGAGIGGIVSLISTGGTGVIPAIIFGAIVGSLVGTVAGIYLSNVWFDSCFKHSYRDYQTA